MARMKYRTPEFSAHRFPTSPNTHPGAPTTGTPDIVTLGIESIGGASSCSGGIGFRQLV